MRLRLLTLNLLAAASLGLVLGRAEREQGQTALQVLDVGQGDAILLRSGGADVLVDGGPDATVVRRLGEVRPASDKRLEVVILTHPDLDHVGGLPAVFAREEIGLLVLPAVAAGDAPFRAVLASAVEQRVPVRFARPGQQLRAGGLRLTVLAPDASALRLARKKANNGSLVLRAEVGAPGLSTPDSRFTVLLTGDIERAAEQLLLRRAGRLLDVDVLKVPHHGSRTSTSLRLLRAATPALALVSVGAGNRYGHPHPNVLRRLRGVAVYRTDHHGTISLAVRRGLPVLTWSRGSSQKDLPRVR